MINKLLTACCFLLLIACDPGNMDDRSPMVSPIDTRYEMEDESEQTQTLTSHEAQALLDQMQEISAKANAGALPYTVTDGKGILAEATTYFKDEDKSTVLVVKMITLSGGSANVYFMNENTRIIEEAEFIYIFRNNELVIAKAGEEAITVSEKNKKDMANTLTAAEEIAADPELKEK